MYIYRPHKGGLEESMELKKEFATKRDMLEYIYQDWFEYAKSTGRKSPFFRIEDIEIDENNPFEDDRIGWHNTMYVCIKRFDDEDYIKRYGTPQCVGMCATDYDE